jgi:hypothetical protein
MVLVESSVDRKEMSSDDEIIRIIASEIQTGQLDSVTWTRAFAEADGNHDRAKARYIRERQAQFQAGMMQPSPAAKVAEQAPATSRPAPARPRSELEVKREILAKKLSQLGRRSLYSELELHPASDNAIVNDVIAKLSAAEAQGRVLSAEERYAIQMLRDPVSREQYDRKLLEELSRQDAAPEAVDVSQRGTILGRPISVIAMVGVLAIIVFATLAVYQEKSRKELVREALQMAQQAEAARLERERQAAAVAAERQAEAADQAAQMAEQQATMRQRQIDDQARLRTTQIEYQHEQMEERKRQSALAKQQAEARMEQEKTRRTIYETERELCLTARRNNNAGEMTRWCR